MKISKLKEIKVLVIITSILAVAVTFFVVSRDNTSIIEQAPQIDGLPITEEFEADMLGLGSAQMVQVIQNDNSVEFRLIHDNQEVSRSLFDDGSIKPSPTHSIIQLDNSSSKEFIRWDQVVGPHQTETFILTVHEGNFYTIPSGDFANRVWYQPFWNIRGKLVIGDLNGDGLSEIVEFVDEYPPESPRLIDEELEKITIDSFQDKGVAEMAEEAWTIVSRENYGEGRGRKVVWGIHTFVPSNPPFIRKLEGNQFDQIAKIIIEASNSVNDTTPNYETESIISKYQLVQDSIDFNQFVRQFWTHDFPYEKPMQIPDEIDLGEFVQ